MILSCSIMGERDLPECWVCAPINNLPEVAFSVYFRWEGVLLLLPTHPPNNGMFFCSWSTYSLPSCWVLTPCPLLKKKFWHRTVTVLCVSCSVMSNSLWPHGPQPSWLLCPWNSPGQKTGMGSHSLLHGIFLTQELTLGLLHYRQILYHLSHLE